MPRQLAAADEAHKLEFHQRLDDRVDRDAADLLDLGLRDRLAIGDDRQRLEGGAGEAAGTVQLEQRAHVASARGGRLQTVGAAGAHEAETAAGTLELLLEPAQGLVDLARRAALVDGHHLGVLALLRRDAAHAGAQLVRGQRRLAREEQRADDLLEGGRQRDPRPLRLRRLGTRGLPGRHGRGSPLDRCRGLLRGRNGRALGRRPGCLSFFFFRHFKSQVSNRRRVHHRPSRAQPTTFAVPRSPLVRSLEGRVVGRLLGREHGDFMERGVLVHDDAVLAQ